MQFLINISIMLKQHVLVLVAQVLYKLIFLQYIKTIFISQILKINIFFLIFDKNVNIYEIFITYNYN